MNYIAIAGNIGSGKTTLTQMLSKRLGYDAYYENLENPYLSDFYNDMGRWSFNLQLYFLGRRLHGMQEILARNCSVVQDRTIFEDAHIFATNLHEMGLMATRDYETYMDLFEMSAGQIRKPDLLIYLRASVPTLISQIQRRGRVYEMAIQESYLSKLNERYEDWIAHKYHGAVLTLDIDREDFILDASVVDRLVEQLAIESNNL